MKIAIISGSGGLIGSEAVGYYCQRFDLVVGIDNDMRKYFFGDSASTTWNVNNLKSLYDNYRHYDTDIRDSKAIEQIFQRYQSDIKLVIHTAAQPSHDWAAKEPQIDFSVNATGTLNMLEACKQHSPKAVFIFTSTNKVYGDRPNTLPLRELESRWEIDPDHAYYDHGIDENMSIDMSKHSLFGASKVAADVLVQEYGRYFDMKTACFRGGCLTGPAHSGAMLHGFLSYLMRCVMTGKHYTVFGYAGKQVRDNIHSLDLIYAFDAFYQQPRVAEVYNIGGGRYSNCSMLEAIATCEEISGTELDWKLGDDARSGDHIWWVSDIRKFMGHYPNWKITYDVSAILKEIYEHNASRWVA